jgi:hypothetical protein
VTNAFLRPPVDPIFNAFDVQFAVQVRVLVRRDIPLVLAPDRDGICIVDFLALTASTAATPAA